MYTSEIMRRRIIIPSPGILTDYDHSPWGECIAVVGAAADDPDVMPELICDGIHIHPCMVRNTFRLFGAHRMILISDSMRAVGMEDGQYTLGGQEVTVRRALATLADGTIAGSATPSGHSEGRESIIVCCELFVAGRCPKFVSYGFRVFVCI